MPESQPPVLPGNPAVRDSGSASIPVSLLGVKVFPRALAAPPNGATVTVGRTTDTANVSSLEREPACHGREEDASAQTPEPAAPEEPAVRQAPGSSALDSHDPPAPAPARAHDVVFPAETPPAGPPARAHHESLAAQPARQEARLPHPTDSRPWDPAVARQEQLVDIARLTERAGRSEMRIELRTEALGTMAIRAVLKENQLGAAIGVEGRDAQAILVSELPHLEQNLADRNVRLDHVEVFQGPLGGGSGEGGHQHAHPSPENQHPAFKAPAPGGPTMREPSLPHEQPFEAGPPGRLSVRV